jgi:hypothetical protein
MVLGMVFAALPPLLWCPFLRRFSAISLSYQSRCKHLSISVSSASLRISPHAGPVNPQQNKTSFAPFGSGNWKFELTVCLLACLLGRSRSIIILGRCRDGGAVAGWG